MDGADMRLKPRTALPSATVPGHVVTRRPVVPPPAPSSEVAPHLKPQARDLRDYWIGEMRRRIEELSGLASDYGAGTMPLWDGDPESQVKDKWGRKNKRPVWEMLLAECQNQGINPYKFLRYQAGQWVGTSPPHPNFVLCAEAFNSYRSAPREDERARVSLEIQRAHARTRFSELSRDVSFSSDTTRWLAVVLDRRPPLTALFCYCLARQLGLEAGVARRRQAAVRQYLVDRELYDTVWGSDIPPELASATIEQLFAETARAT